MDVLPNSPRHANNRIVTYENPLTGEIARQQYILSNDDEREASPSFNIGLIVHRYWLMMLTLIVLGAAAGFGSVVLSSPMYRTRLLLEVHGVNESWLKNTIEVSSFEANEVNIQTQINILRSGSFLGRGADRLQSDTVPLAPAGRDLFSRLRQRIHPATQDPIENTTRGIAVAVATFDARPINRTRLIELSCESTSPDVAAHFLNSMAAEFVEDTSRSRMLSSQKTGEWISAQIEDTKTKLQEAEERLHDFVQASGNLFAGQETTLDDTKLANLKGELARIQAERIAKQTRYELTLKSPPESLPEILGDTTLRGHQQQISSLKQEKAALETTYTAKHEKVRRLDAQLTLLAQTYQNEVSVVIDRIRNEYEAASRQEKLLTLAYDVQSQRVGSDAGKASQYNALKREVETLRQMYQSLLMQGNQVGLSSSVPVSPIRIVEPSLPPEQPYKPRPVLNISFGAAVGIAVGAGIASLRERFDRSIRSPGSTRRLLQAPELGVIPSLQLNGNWITRTVLRDALSLSKAAGNEVTALTRWQNTPPFIAESFRGTLTSILRNQKNETTQKIILVTSAGPAEGKTTVVQNLGIALAETGRKILLVDADFRRPQLHQRFDLSNELSLIDLISTERSFADYPPEKLALSTGIPGLSVMPNRPTNNHVAKALYSPRLSALFHHVREKYDMVLVDAPPILNLADARIIAPLTDAVILVLRCKITDRESAMQAYQRLREDGLFLLGTVLTDWKFSSSYGKRHYYYDYVESKRT